MSYAVLSYWDIALAACLLFVNAGLSLAFRLGLGKRLLIAGTRMMVQLTMVGLVLKALFALSSPLYTGLAALVMVLFAGREAMARQDRRFAGYWSYGIGTGSMMTAGLIVTVFGLSTQIQADPWYDPRYALPILGMILGNTMNGVSLGLDRLLTGAVQQRSAIEAQLMLGRDMKHAMRGVMRDAIRAGLIPITNSMAAAGLVSLPGMMTGQILAGVEPVEAVKYQILIIFLIAGGTGLGTFVAVLAASRRLTDERQRLRLDRLTAKEAG
ncbi:MAG: iron export ABC transporter permease subunit FetB [Rhodospirillales bacterium]|nr:iron export ABC transporter permease subunit FetB [Alphaproteobacteria bacterium]MBL6948716.1 iron export ABC transporter permease subunit FetB [Rhodospirillales bacterium]